MTLTPEQLDRILALQLAVAGASEGQSQPACLRRWRTDLADNTDEGDLLSRLLPRTRECVREPVRQADERARGKMACALHDFGLHLDKQLAERFAEHKRRAEPLEEVVECTKRPPAEKGIPCV